MESFQSCDALPGSQAATRKGILPLIVNTSHSLLICPVSTFYYSYGLMCFLLNILLVINTAKALKTLQSKTAPVVKKRALMNTLFGDYRAKMAAEEEQISKG